MAPDGATFSWRVLLTLLLVLGLSCWVFWQLASRWTTRRPRLALAEWAGGHGCRLFGADSPAVPAPMAGWADPPPRAELSLVGPRTTILQMRTGLVPAAARPPGQTMGETSCGMAGAPMGAGWNVLVRAIESDWPPTGLRPGGAVASIVDLLPLSNIPGLAPPERFAVVGSNLAAARRLAASRLLALLPPDIGLLLHGKSMVLDFTARPFDPIELSRMLAVAEQLAAHLPGGS